MLLVGRILAQTGIRYYEHFTWYPIYGAARRGGPCECTVILSDKEIGSPVLRQAQAAICFEPTSAKAVEQRVQTGGYFIANGTDLELERDDIKHVLVPGDKIASGVGNPRAVNFVLLGVYLGLTDAISLAGIKQIVSQQGKKGKALSANLEALKEGFHIAYYRGI